MKKDVLFVGIQILLFVAYLWGDARLGFEININVQHGGLALAGVGLLIILVAVLQLNKSLSPFPSPMADGKLITNGLYAFIRHPIYTGISMVGFGYGMYRESWWKLLITLAIYTLFHFKAKYEESLLMSKFEEYGEYKKRTGRFLPKWRSN